MEGVCCFTVGIGGVGKLALSRQNAEASSPSSHLRFLHNGTRNTSLTRHGQQPSFVLTTRAKDLLSSLSRPTK